MGIIKLETKIKSTPEICFDLSRSVDLHMTSAKRTNEKAIEGVTTGMMNLGDEVTWEAKHFGVVQKLKIIISKFDRPNHFQDKQLKGIFKSFSHDHFFILDGEYTLMKDHFEFKCPLGLLGSIVDPFIFRHLKKFLIDRNNIIKSVAESDQWQKYI